MTLLDPTTVNGADAILKELKVHAGRAVPGGFAIDPDRAAPRRVMRAGTNAIEATNNGKAASADAGRCAFLE